MYHNGGGPSDKLKPRPPTSLPMQGAAQGSAAPRTDLTGWLEEAMRRLGALGSENSMLAGELEKSLRRLARTQAEAMLVQHMVGLGAALGAALGGAPTAAAAAASAGEPARAAFGAAVAPYFEGESRRLGALSERLLAAEESKRALEGRLLEAAFGAALTQARERELEDLRTQRMREEESLRFVREKALQDSRQRFELWRGLLNASIDAGVPPPEFDVLDSIARNEPFTPEQKQKVYDWMQRLMQAQQTRLAMEVQNIMLDQARLGLERERLKLEKRRLELSEAEKLGTLPGQAAKTAGAISSLSWALRQDDPLVDRNELMRQYAPLGMLAGTVRTLTELDRRLAGKGASALTPDEIELARHSYYQLITAVLQGEDDPEERETALRILRSTFPHIDRLMPRRTGSKSR